MAVFVEQYQVEPPQAPMRPRSSVTVVPGEAPFALDANRLAARYSKCTLLIDSNAEYLVVRDLLEARLLLIDLRATTESISRPRFQPIVLLC